MTSHNLTHRTICALLLGTAMGVIGEGALNGQSPGQMWFTAFPPLRTPVDANELTRYGLQRGNVSSTILGAALGQICTLSSRGVASNPIYPFGTSYRGPINLALGSLTGNPSAPPVIFAGPGMVSDLPMTVYSAGPPPVRVGDVPMGSDMRFGMVIASGDVTGTAAHEVFVTPGPGGPPVIYIFDMTRNDGVPFYPFGQNHQGNFRLALGRFNSSGYDQLVVTQTNGGMLKIFEFLRGVEPHEVASGSPFLGLPPDVLQSGGVFPAAFDLNGNGRDDLIVSPGDGPPQVRAFSLTNLLGDYDPIVIGDFQAFDEKTHDDGARVSAGRVNGLPVISATAGSDWRLFFVVGQGWEHELDSNPWGVITSMFLNVQMWTSPAR